MQNSIEDVGPEEAAARATPVLGQIGKGHAVVGEHGMDLIGEDLHGVAEEGRALHLARAVVELDVGELGNPVDGEEHDQLAVGVAQLAAIDVNVADLVGLEPFALLPGLLDRQPGDAVALQASVQGAATEVRDRVSQATQDIVQRQQGLLPERHHDRLLGRRQHRARRLLRTHRRVGRCGPVAPFAHGLRVQAVAGGKGPAALFRRLELGSKTRRRSGAAMKNACHRASSS